MICYEKYFTETFKYNKIDSQQGQLQRLEGDQKCKSGQGQI